MRMLLFSLASIFASSASLSVEPLGLQPQTTNGPDCSGRWLTNIALSRLRSAGLAPPKSIDYSKTKTVRLASEKINKDLWRQVYDVKYEKTSGELLEAIVVHEASSDECSMGGGDVFPVSQHFRPGGK